MSENVWQYFVVIPDMKSVGVKEIPHSVLHKVATRITSEVDGINRVLYDIIRQTYRHN